MQDLVAVKMTASADERQARAQLAACTRPELDGWVRPHDPRPLGLVQVDRRDPEGMAPLDHRCVVMGVRDCDLGDPAELADPCDRRVVDESDAIPKDIPLAGLNQERTLADPEPGFGVDRVEAWLFLLDDILVG